MTSFLLEGRKKTVLHKSEVQVVPDKFLFGGGYTAYPKLKSNLLTKLFIFLGGGGGWGGGSDNQSLSSAVQYGP